MKIRTATPADLEAVAAIEAACFPPAEAAGRASLAGRLDVYPGHFWLLEEGDQIVGFVNGMCTDAPDLADASPRTLARRLIDQTHGKTWVSHPLLDRWVQAQAARWQKLWR